MVKALINQYFAYRYILPQLSQLQSYWY